jgi:outer membrane biosynthesis protein TonB
VNPFVPKPGTPFQWLPMEDPKETDRKLQYLRKAFAKIPNVDAVIKSARSGLSQSALALGDRRMADALEVAVTERMDFKRAMKLAGLDAAFYLFRGRGRDEVLPWDLIDNGVSKAYYLRELDKSYKEKLSPHCPEIQGCIRCGVCVEDSKPFLQAAREVEGARSATTLPPRPDAFMSAPPVGREHERGSAAAVVAVLLLAALLALAAYVAWGLLLTPQVSSVSPNPAAEKTAILLRGSHFAAAPGGNIVLFGEQTGHVLRTGPSELEVQVPDLGLPSGRQARVPVRVLVEGRVSEVVELTIGLPAPPAPTPTPTPETTPEPTVSPEPTRPEPRVARTAPSPAVEPKPKPATSPTPGPAQVLAEAETAAEAHEFERAIPLYEEALRQEPTNSKAKAGLESARTAAAALARGFVLGKTQVEGGPARGDIKSFDARDVSVRKPAEVAGRIEIEAAPTRVKPGDAVHYQGLAAERRRQAHQADEPERGHHDRHRPQEPPYGAARARGGPEAAGARRRDLGDLGAGVEDLAPGGPDHLRSWRDVREPALLEVGRLGRGAAATTIDGLRRRSAPSRIRLKARRVSSLGMRPPAVCRRKRSNAVPLQVLMVISRGTRYWLARARTTLPRNPTRSGPGPPGT